MNLFSTWRHAIVERYFDSFSSCRAWKNLLWYQLYLMIFKRKVRIMPNVRFYFHLIRITLLSITHCGNHLSFRTIWIFNKKSQKLIRFQISSTFQKLENNQTIWAYLTFTTSNCIQIPTFIFFNVNVLKPFQIPHRDITCFTARSIYNWQFKITNHYFY